MFIVNNFIIFDTLNEYQWNFFLDLESYEFFKNKLIREYDSFTLLQ